MFPERFYILSLIQTYAYLFSATKNLIKMVNFIPWPLFKCYRYLDNLGCFVTYDFRDSIRWDGFTTLPAPRPSSWKQVMPPPPPPHCVWWSRPWNVTPLHHDELRFITLWPRYSYYVLSVCVCAGGGGRARMLKQGQVTFGNLFLLCSKLHHGVNKSCLSGEDPSLLTPSWNI